MGQEESRRHAIPDDMREELARQIRDDAESIESKCSRIGARMEYRPEIAAALQRAMKASEKDRGMER